MNSVSWPTHRPTITFRSQPASFKMRACMTGLHVGSKQPGCTFTSSAMPARSFATAPTLQATAHTSSKPLARRIRANACASSMSPMHVAMPILRAPMRRANTMTSSTRVSWL